MPGCLESARCLSNLRLKERLSAANTALIASQTRLKSLSFALALENFWPGKEETTLKMTLLLRNRKSKPNLEKKLYHETI
jgi:hypothetical protein